MGASRRVGKTDCPAGADLAMMRIEHKHQGLEGYERFTANQSAGDCAGHR